MNQEIQELLNKAEDHRRESEASGRVDRTTYHASIAAMYASLATAKMMTNVNREIQELLNKAEDHRRESEASGRVDRTTLHASIAAMYASQAIAKMMAA
jgi:hypothetical protein